MTAKRGEGPVPAVDVAKMYVGVKATDAHGNVRFDFAIGWPELSVELVLPQSAFDEFCRHNNVKPMPAGAGEAQSFGEGDKA